LGLVLGLAAWQLPAQGAAPLVCGIAIGYPPYQFIDAAGAPAGIDAEVTRLVFREMGSTCRFSQKEWDEVYLGLAHRTGAVDLLCGAEINPERRTLFDFSTPYYNRAVAIFVRSASPYRTLRDLDNQIITGDRGAWIESRIDKSRLRVIDTPSKEEAFRKLRDGKVEAVIAPLAVGNWLCRQSGLSVRTLPERDAGSPVAFAVAKGNTALARRLSAAVEKLLATGQIAAILRKYL
jgi:polar amino acid transport system substrate-binding protein